MSAPAVRTDLDDLAHRAALPGVRVAIICACYSRRHPQSYCGAPIPSGRRDCVAGCRSSGARDCGAFAS